MPNLHDSFDQLPIAAPTVTVDPGLSQYFSEFQPNIGVFGSHLGAELPEEDVTDTTVHFSAQDNDPFIGGLQTAATYEQSTKTVKVYPLRLLRNEILADLDTVHDVYGDESISSILSTAVDMTLNHQLSYRIDGADPQHAEVVAAYGRETADRSAKLMKKIERRNLAAWAATEAGLLAAENAIDAPWVVSTLVFLGTTGLAVFGNMRQLRNQLSSFHLDRHYNAPHVQRARAAETADDASEDFVTLRLKPGIEADPAGFYQRWKVPRLSYPKA